MVLTSATLGGSNQAYVTMPGTNLWLKLTVTDGGGFTKTTDYFVQNMYSSGGCTVCPDYADLDEGPSAFSVYPNPISEPILHISTTYEIENTEVFLYTLDGKLSQRSRVYFQDQRSTMRIKNNQSGIYLLKINHDQYEYSKVISIH